MREERYGMLHSKVQKAFVAEEAGSPYLRLDVNFTQATACSQGGKRPASGAAADVAASQNSQLWYMARREFHSSGSLQARRQASRFSGAADVAASPRHHHGD
eukprot:scaffold62505_cov18-Tisochrysis_lutea.AAC.1